MAKQKRVVRTPQQRTVSARKKSILKLLKSISRKIEKFPEHENVDHSHVVKVTFILSELTHISNIVEDGGNSGTADRS